MQFGEMSDWLGRYSKTPVVCMDWILEFLDPDSRSLQQDQKWDFLCCIARVGFDLDFVIAEQTLPVVWLNSFTGGRGQTGVGLLMFS